MAERTHKDMAVMTKTLIETGIQAIPKERAQDYIDIVEWLDAMAKGSLEILGATDD